MRAILAFALLLLAFAAPARAQEIVVQGNQVATAHNFVTAMTDPRRDRQLGRWNGKICPAVVGIAPAQASYMTQRIAEIAAPLGLRTLGGSCTPSMLILVTPDAAALAASLADRFPIELRKDGRSNLNRFVRTNNAVRWLSVTDPCGFGGCPATGSRLSVSTQPEFQAMIVIVDATKIGGYTLSEISDYVALVALGNPPLAGQWPSSSILSMFDAAHPTGIQFALTDRDRSFLSGLYRSRINASGQQQRSSVEQSVREGTPKSPPDTP
jgi:hypothetical protein